MRLSCTLLLALAAGGVGEGQRTYQVTHDSSIDWMPALSANGRLVVWWKRTASADEIWSADTRLLAARRLLTLAANPFQMPNPLAVSGDGSTVAYERGGQLWVLTSPGKPPRQVSRYPSSRRVLPFFGGISLSHDGRYACYPVYDSTLGSVVEVADTRTARTHSVPPSPVRVSGPVSCWVSGDGNYVALGYDPRGYAPALWLARISGTLVRQVAAGGGGTVGARISHDGSLLAFQTGQVSSASSAVHVVQATGAGRITLSRRGTENHACLAANGARVSFQMTRSGRHDVYLVRTDGTGLRQITTAGDLDPKFFPSAHSLSGNGTLCAFVSGGEVYLWRDALSRAGDAKPGSVIHLDLDVPSAAGAGYVMRCSFGRSPGLRIPGAGVVGLNPDPLFHLSGAAPALFRGFEGFLDARGQGRADIVVPPDPGLRGVVFYAAFVTLGTRVVIYPEVKTVLR